MNDINDTKRWLEGGHALDPAPKKRKRDWFTFKLVIFAAFFIIWIMWGLRILWKYSIN